LRPSHEPPNGALNVADHLLRRCGVVGGTNVAGAGRWVERDKGDLAVYLLTSRGNMYLLTYIYIYTHIQES